MKKRIDLTEDKTTRMTNGLFSSRTEEWETPQYVFDWLDEQFRFQLDVCATVENKKCEDFISKEMNGLNQNWGLKRCWMNPPYGKDIFKWMHKAYTSSQAGALVVCLVHARTDTRWFHDYAMKADEIWFIKGRLKFGDGKQSAPFPSCVVIFRPLFGNKNIYNTPLTKSIKIGSRHLESLRGLKDFAGGSQSSNENLPQTAETYRLFKEE